MSIDERLELIRRTREEIEVHRDFIEAELCQAAGAIVGTVRLTDPLWNAIEAARKIQKLREQIADGAE